MEALRPLSGQRVQRQDLGAADMIDRRVGKIEDV
jgi:hypothetical protein